jgi:hypothetical protein
MWTDSHQEEHGVSSLRGGPRAAERSEWSTTSRDRPTHTAAFLAEGLASARDPVPHHHDADMVAGGDEDVRVSACHQPGISEADLAMRLLASPWLSARVQPLVSRVVREVAHAVAKGVSGRACAPAPALHPHTLLHAYTTTNRDGQDHVRVVYRLWPFEARVAVGYPGGPMPMHN